MIVRYRFEMTSDHEKMIPSFWAYRAYSWLLMHCPEEIACALHEEGEKPLGISIWYDKKKQKSMLEINLFSDLVLAALSPVLDYTKEIDLHSGCIRANLIEQVCFSRPDDLINFIHQESAFHNRMEMRFLTPTGFKQMGRYVIFPQIPLILQSLMNKWNHCFPAYSLDDADAFGLMAHKLWIVDYSLRSARYSLKGTKIPGFYGNIIIESSLPAPLEEIWQLLLAFAPYGGVGIKTTLGMGKVECAPYVYKMRDTSKRLSCE